MPVTMARLRPTRPLRALALCGLLAGLLPASAAEVHFVDQGPAWTAQTRSLFYDADQGSQLIPYAWLAALHQPDGTPFLDGALARYGYIPRDPSSRGLPVGFTATASEQGSMVGMTCAACHTRQIEAGGQAYRIDGGPAFADFASFVADLDAAVRRVLADDAAFRPFAAAVLGKARTDPAAVAVLRVEVEVWSTRFHTLMSRALPKGGWGPARLDAMGMIFNRVGGLDLGVAPTYLIAGNIQRADAPTRYPFLWNAPRQDRTQWSGFAQNGNDFLALARNLGQLYGVFGTFHPRPAPSGAPINRDYLAENSANLRGLATNEALLKRLAPPVWPWAVDRALAARGRAVFDLPVAAGGCAACHGIREGEPRPPEAHSLRTPIMDVGTDTRQWDVLVRPVRTGSLEGASLPGLIPPLGPTEPALQVLKMAVLGALSEAQPMQASTPPAKMPMPHDQMDGTVKMPAAPGGATTSLYEARVLQGVWAAAPYLHNGSVPTLADLLRPAAQRPTRVPLGAAYDKESVGLAKEQGPHPFVLVTTGCELRNSGNSRCGHEFGTALSEADKRALLEYLKTL